MGAALKHLAEERRIEIARGLFRVTSEDESRGELIGLCPIHEDRNPSFAYNYRQDLFNCSACGAAGDLAELWSQVKGHAPKSKDGYRSFCREFGIGQDPEKTGSPDRKNICSQRYRPDPAAGMK